MTIELRRKYYPEGTNGELFDGEVQLCFTIELPWIENQRSISCIPEGKYQLVKRFSKTHKWHIEISNVPDRSSILIHLANIALKELQGCIAPVTYIEGPGKGSRSKSATEQLHDYIFEKMKTEIVHINITSKK